MKKTLGLAVAFAVAFTGTVSAPQAANATGSTVTITYDPNGATSGTAPGNQTATLSTRNTLETNSGKLEKTDYTFVGWNTSPTYNGAAYLPGDATYIPAATANVLYAQWSPNSQTVTYNGNGNTGGLVPASHKDVKVDTKITLAQNVNNLTRTGYKIVGWNTQANGVGTPYDFGASHIVSGKTPVLYAQWSPNTNTLTYDTNGATSGTIIKPITLATGTKIMLPTNDGDLKRTGHYFGGWNDNSAGTSVQYPAGTEFTMPGTPKVLYAKWFTLAPISYIIYNRNGATGGSLPGAQRASPTANVVTPSYNKGNLSRTGYTFIGWNTKADGTGNAYKEGQTNVPVPKAGLILYADWSPNSLTNITYDANGATAGTAPAPRTNLKTASLITLDENTGNLTRTGYTFGGWNTNADRTGTNYAAGLTNYKVPAESLTLFAHWTPLSKTISYDETVVVNGATTRTVYNEVLAHGARTLLRATPATLKENQVFTGWNTNADGSGTLYQPNAVFTPTEDISLYPTWSSTVTVTFNLNEAVRGTTPAPQTATPGTTITVPQVSDIYRNLTKVDNYEFVGWNTQKDLNGQYIPKLEEYTVPNHDITLYAHWALPYVDIIYDADGGINAPWPGSKYLTSETVTLFGPKNVSRQGYAFASWNTARNGAGKDVTSVYLFDRSVTVYARWTPTAQLINYLSKDHTSGTLPADRTGLTEDKITLATNTGNLEKTGYIFDGWTDRTGATYKAGGEYVVRPSGNTLYPKWIGATRTITYNVGNAEAGTPPASTKAITGTKVMLDINVGSTQLRRAGYTFNGWTANSDNSGPRYEAAGYAVDVPYSVTNLYPAWTRSIQAVTYNSNGATSGKVAASTYPKTEDVITLDNNSGNLVNRGYNLIGWNTKADGSGTFYKLGQTLSVPGTGLSLYAQWGTATATSTGATTMQKIIYKSSYATSGSAPETLTAPAGSTYTPSINTGDLKRSGFFFNGWTTSLSRGFTRTPGQTYTVPNSTTYLYPIWSTLAKNTVVYNTNGGTGKSFPSQKSATNVQITLPINAHTTTNRGVLTRPGYVFLAWNTNANGTGTRYDPLTKFSIPAAGIQLYAQWAPSTYQISYDGNKNTGGTVAASIKPTTGITVTLDKNSGALTRTGYTITGWNTNAAGTGIHYPFGAVIAVPTADLTLYAQWEILKNINFNTGETTNAPKTQVASTGSKINLPTAKDAVKTGHALVAWTTQENGQGTTYLPGASYTVPNADSTLYAKWVKATTISFNLGSASLATGTAPDPIVAEPGTTILLPQPTFSAAVLPFIGWNTDPDGGLAGTFVDAYSRKYTVTDQDVTFYPDWATTPTVSVMFLAKDADNTSGTPPKSIEGAAVFSSVTLPGPGSLVKEGHVFRGWKDVQGNFIGYENEQYLVYRESLVPLYADWLAIESTPTPTT